MIEQVFDASILMPLATFAAIALGVWVLLTIVVDRRNPALDRLERLSKPLRRGSGNDPRVLKRMDRIQDMLARAAPTLSKPLMPKTDLERNSLKTWLANAGLRSEHATEVYLGFKAVFLVLGLTAVGGLRIGGHGLNYTSLWITVLGGAIGLYLPTVVVWFLRKQRQEKIFLGLPDALDLLVVCVEAGLGLDAGMRKVSDEMVLTCPLISEELALANFQLQMGRPRREVLHDFGVRTGVDDCRSLAAILIQADRFGSSIAQALRVQSDSMRVRRRQLAEERAAKTAVQLLFPLILFIFPGIFVVLVGPAAIQIARDLLPKMAGASGAG